MLDRWLGPVSRETFVAEHLQRAPLAQPGTVDSSVLDWPLLERVLQNDPDTLVVAGGKLLPFPPPRELVEVRAYFRMGIGLAMRQTCRCTPETRAIADAFRWIGPSHVQMFITPANTHGFGWHYDDEDVFIAQTTGVKDYFFRPNTVTDAPAHADQFVRFTDETSPIYSATLHGGDFLYIPARWWHMAKCREDALSVSVGVFTDRRLLAISP
ncbi:MAG TPA: cupin domain-containing protein [Kofleriaceae bacterium]|nr:cupin domain-containing protein [Kofleriaceae bacterium]